MATATDLDRLRSMERGRSRPRGQATRRARNRARSAHPTATQAAVAALTEFRAAAEMRLTDGWMIKRLRAETRQGRRVLGFVLVAWRTTEDEAARFGDEVQGYAERGEVRLEAYSCARATSPA